MQVDRNKNNPSDAQQAAWIALQRVGPILGDRINAELAANGLPGLSEYSVLWAIERVGEPVRPRDLGLMLFLKPYQVSRLIDRMVDDGLVEKRKCPEDARGFFLALTPNGQKKRLEMWNIYGPAMADVMSPLSDEEADQIAALLDRLA